MRRELRDCKLFLKNQLRPCSSFIKNTRLLFRYGFHWIRLAHEIHRYKKLKKTPPVLLCMANPGSVGGTELQVQIIGEALKQRFGECLILISGKVEGGGSNLFLKRLLSLQIPFLKLRSIGQIPYEKWPLLQKATSYLLGKVLKNSKICHFFNPSSTLLAPVIKSFGLAIYYMETGMPALESWWQNLERTREHFDYVTSVSLAGLRRLETLYGYKGPSCVTPSMFHPLPERFLCKEPCKGVFDIVYFGRMTRGKGLDLLIRAFSRLIKQFPFATLSLIGSGERLSDLKILARELHIADAIQFTDWLQGEALFSRLIEVDLYCLPSYTEGMPSSILEAMSIGLPILATDVGGVSEIIEHNVSGVLIPPGDEEALTKTLLALAEDPTHRARLSKGALLRWKKVGTKEVILEQLMAAYQTFISS